MSSYVDENLNTGESVLYRTRLHWSVFVWPALFAFMMLFPALGFIGGGLSSHDSSGMVVAGMIALIIGLIPLGIAYLRRASAEFAVTDKRVILKFGVFQHRSAEMFLTKIESISVAQNLLGKMLNYGTIVVRGTGGTPEPFVKLDHPLEFKRQVQSQVEKAGALSSAATAR